MQPTPPAGPSLPENTVEIIAALTVAAVIAGALALIVGGLVRRFLTSIEGERALAHSVTRATVRAVRVLTFVITLAIVALPALEIAGIETTVGLEGNELVRWLGRTGIRIGLILTLAFIANRIAGSLIARAQRELVTGSSLADYERQKRAETMGRMFTRFLSLVVWATAFLMILQTLDVNIAPVLTGAGILGLAIGFGAQTLVKDFISGIFIILEDQVRVGDVAVLNGVSGMVEQINLRTIVLRDAEGVVHVVPNGEIRTLANRTKDFSYALLDFGLDYQSDVDKAIDEVKAVAAEIRRDPAFAPSILEPLEVLGVEDLRESSLLLRFRMKTVPLKQWEVVRELRRRVKRAFDDHGLRFPMPQMEVLVRQGQPAPRELDGVPSPSPETTPAQQR